MAIFLCLYALLFFFTVFTWRVEKQIAPFLFFLLSFMVLLLPGLRDVTIGADTKNYVNYFLYPERGYGGDARNIDKGFQIWNQIVRHVWEDGNFYIFFNVLLSLSGIYYFIYKESSYKVLSLLLFVIVEEFYSIQFTAMRQTLAISLFLIALHLYLKNKKNWKIALPLYLLGVMFHATVLWCLGAIIVTEIVKVSKTTAYILLAVSFIIGQLNLFDYHNIVGDIFSATDAKGSRYQTYTKNIFVSISISSKQALSGTLPLSLLAALCIYFTDNINNSLLKLFIVGVMVNNITIWDPIAFRLVMYLVLLIIVVLPNVFKRRGYLAIGVYLLTIAYFVYKSNALLGAQLSPNFKGNKIVPYRAFFE